VIQRGYVEEWLVCGPFDGGDPGVVARVSGRLLPVPDGDFLESVGGVRRVRPEEGLVVKADSGDLIWEELRVRNVRLDFSTLIDDATEANVFAACSIRAGQAMDLLIDFQTLLGARLWLNGFPVAMPSPASPTAAGLQRHVSRLRRGDNHFLMQVPLASLDAVASAEGITAESLRDAVMATRSMLSNATGYEAAIRFRPAARAGQLVFVPRMVETGRFTGEGRSLAQELAVELFNPGPGNAGPAVVRARFGPSDPWIEKASRAIPPQTRVELLFGMPLSGFEAGEIRQADIQVETQEAKGAFTARIAVRASPSRGTAYVLTGLTGPVIDASQSEDAKRRMTALSRHATLLEYEPDYGLYLGGVESWRPFLILNPDARVLLREAVTRGRVSANGGFAVPDERLVSGELLARNLLHGHDSAIDWLGQSANTYHDWHARGIAPQTAQLLAQSRFVGRTLSAAWLTDQQGPLWVNGLDGSRLAAWALPPITEPRTAAELQTQVVAAREALLGSGIDSGIYVAEVAGESAPVYVLNETEALRETIPSIRFEASGPARTFESVREFGDRNPSAFPEVHQLPAISSLGELLVQRPVKDAYAQAEGMTAMAERFASLAAMQGAPYPHDVFDHAWRQLLFYSEPNVLGRAESPIVFMDALNGFHGVAASADTEMHRALTALASEINTASNSPRSTKANSALVVFNPSFHSRTDVCEWRIPPRVGGGFSIIDESGTPVAHALRREPGGAYVQFVVHDLPALGYRTFYLVPGGSPPGSRPGDPNTIENAFYRIVVDPERGGAIANLETKETGTGLLGGLGNDVIVLDEDAERVRGGRDIWISGVAERASETAAQVQTTRSSVSEQMRIVSPLAGGEVTRTITLFRDVPRIDFETTFRGVNAQDRALAIQFGMTSQGRTLITGERYGATANAAGEAPLSPRTANGRFESPAYPRAALRWASLSASDHISAGANVAIPIRPTVVVHDGDAYESEARAVARALAGRGISAVVHNASNTQELNDSIGQGHTFVLSIGSAAENKLTAKLLEHLDRDGRDSAENLIAAGQPFAIGNVRIAEGLPLVDALVVGEESTAKTQVLISEVAAAIADRGSLEISPQAYAGPSPRPSPPRGLALLFEGTNLVSQGADGSLTLFAAHDGTWDKDGGALSIESAPLDYSIAYSLFPFEGDWRTAAIPSRAEAHVNPLRAVQTALHLGKLPSEHSFGSINNEAFVVTAFKAALATPGYVVRGYEAHGMSLSNALFDVSLPMSRAWRSNPIEENRNPLPAGSQGLRLELEPFTVATYAFEIPAPRKEPRSSSAKQAQFTRYWQHNVGVASNANPSATIMLQGDLTRDDTVTLHVQNEGPSPIEGEVQLMPSTGWTIAPETIGIALQRGEALERKILVIRPEGSPGGVSATLRTEKEEYRDLVMTEPEAFALVMEATDRELVVRVQNRVALPLSGGVEIVLPPDAWSELGGSEAVSPWRVAFDVGPLEEHRAAFVWQGEGPARWYGVKAFGNGHVAYQTVP